MRYHSIRPQSMGNVKVNAPQIPKSSHTKRNMHHNLYCDEAEKSFVFKQPLKTIQAHIECFFMHPLNQTYQSPWNLRLLNGKGNIISRFQSENSNQFCYPNNFGELSPWVISNGTIISCCRRRKISRILIYEMANRHIISHSQIIRCTFSKQINQSPTRQNLKVFIPVFSLE